MPQNRDTVTGFRAIRQYNADVKTESELLHTLRKALPSYFDKEGNFLRQRFDHDLKVPISARSRDGYRLGLRAGLCPPQQPRPNYAGPR